MQKQTVQSAKVLMPKLKELKADEKLGFRDKWMVQAAMLPQGIRDKLEVEIVFNSMGQEDWSIESKVGDFERRGKNSIKRDEPQTIPLPMFLHLASRRVFKKIHDTSGPKPVAMHKRVPKHLIEVLDKVKVMKAIDAYIKEVG